MLSLLLELRLLLDQLLSVKVKTITKTLQTEEVCIESAVPPTLPQFKLSRNKEST